jgi:hypothetical protein
MVRHAAQARLLTAALLAAAGLTACGGKDGGPASSASTTSTAAVSASGNPDLGELRMVDCQAWEHGDVAARKGTVEDLREFAGGPVGSPNGTGAQLPNDVAYRYFDRYCAQSYAAYFKLYKLYTRAAAFTPQH